MKQRNIFLTTLYVVKIEIVFESSSNMESIRGENQRLQQILSHKARYSQTTLLFIQDSKKTRNNSSTESINHSLRLRLTHVAHL